MPGKGLTKKTKGFESLTNQESGACNYIYLTEDAALRWSNRREGSLRVQIPIVGLDMLSLPFLDVVESSIPRKSLEPRLSLTASDILTRAERMELAEDH